MNKHLTRNKDKYNPYTLEVDEVNEIYTVIFKDSNNIEQRVIINKEVYDAFDEFELEDISQIHKIKKHIEHNEVYEETLFHRSIKSCISIEDKIEQKILYEDLKKAIDELNDIQKRRLKKYYFDEMTFEAIAKEENCTKRAVKFSIDIALEKISKKCNKHYILEKEIDNIVLAMLNQHIELVSDIEKKLKKQYLHLNLSKI